MTAEILLNAMGEINDELISRADREKLKPKKRPYGKISIIAAALCGIILAVGILSANINRLRIYDIENVRIYVNVVKDTAQVQLDMDVMIQNYDTTDERFFEQFENDTGIPYKKILKSLPSGYTLDSYHSLLYKGTGSDGYELHDYVVNFTGKDGRSITLAVCPFEAPLRDIIIDTGEVTPSAVNETPITVIGFEDTYYISFESNGIYYDVEMRGSDITDVKTLIFNLTDK